MKVRQKVILFIFIVIIVIILLYVNHKKKEDIIEINIGYQSVTSQTWGALIIKNQKIYEKKLQELYPDKKIKIIWHDEISGSVINTSMISNKIDIGFMGDMPLLLNMYKSDTLEKYDATLIAFDGKGEKGKNQSIIVSKNSTINNVEDLRGKTISTPIGSSAHFMLMKVLKKYNMLDEVEIVHQDVAMASQLLSTNKTDAFAIWDPYPNYLTEEIQAKKLVDGSESDVDYLAGVIINNSLMERDELLVTAFIESIQEAHEFINNNKEKAAKIFAKESGFSYAVAIEEINSIKWDYKINEEDIETMLEKLEFLKKLNQIEMFDVNKKIYIRKEEI